MEAATGTDGALVRISRWLWLCFIRTGNVDRQDLLHTYVRTHARTYTRTYVHTSVQCVVCSIRQSLYCIRIFMYVRMYTLILNYNIILTIILYYIYTILYTIHTIIKLSPDIIRINKSFSDMQHITAIKSTQIWHEGRVQV